MKIDEIYPNPDNPRLIKDARFKKLCKSIKDFPKMMTLRPIIIDADGMILGGNMRFKALKHLKYKDIPDEWVRRADELTDDEKQRFVIEDNVPFGEWDWDALANAWDEEKLLEWGLEIPDTNADDETYTAKIKSPIYEPKNEKPVVTELCDKEKAEELIRDIKASDIGDEDKAFLLLAAQRHLVFNYERIADYYAHSDEKVQKLMENSALVIIDFKKAIELGFVKLSQQIGEQYEKEEQQ